MKKRLLFLILLPLIYSTCYIAVWSELADSVCSGFTDCIKGTTSHVQGTSSSCLCICDEGWCGERCDTEIATCKGTIISYSVQTYLEGEVFSYNGCYCRCPSDIFIPPACSTIRIPFKPKTSDSENEKNNHAVSSIEDDYFPLLEGNKWVFDVLDDYGQVTSEFGVKIPRSLYYEGKLYYDSEFLIPDTLTGLVSDTSVMLGPLFFNRDSDPNIVAQRRNDTLSVPFFYHSYTDGDTLEVNGEEAYISQIGTVTVPAGTYDNCFSVVDSLGGGFIFAGGVGWIAFLTDGDTSAVLKDVEITCSLGVEIAVTNVSCANASDGAFEITTSSDIDSLEFIWDGPTEIEDGKHPANLSAGLYFLTVSNAQCEAIIDSIPVTAPDPIEIELVSATNLACHGDNNGSIDVSISGGSGHIDVMWNDGEYLTEDLSGLIAGCYMLEVMDSLGCVAELTVDITQPEALNIILDPSTVSCFGEDDGMLSPVVSGGMPDYNYQWSNGMSTNSISGLTPGLYGLTITDQANCTAEVSSQISEPEALSSFIANAEDVSCFGFNNGAIEVIVSGGTMPYIFSWNNGAYTAQNLTQLSPGDYILEIKDANDCASQLEATITEPEELVVGLNYQTNNSCFGIADGEASLDISGGAVPYEINWSDGSEGSVISNLESGTYAATVSDFNGCTSEYIIDIEEPDPITINNPDEYHISCFGDSAGSIFIDVTGGTPDYSFNWNNGLFDTQQVNGLPSGQYNIIVTDINGCSAAKTIEVVQPDQLTISLEDQVDISCHDQNDGSLNIGVSGGTEGYAYNWNNGLFDSAQINNLTEGIYEVIVSDQNGCTVSEEFEISSPDEIRIVLESKTDLTCFGDTDGSITISVSGGTPVYNYNWNNNEYTTEDISGLGQGIYNLILTDMNGCIESIDINIDAPEELILTLESTMAIDDMANGTATVIPVGGTGDYNYLWDDALSQTTQTATDLLPDIYQVTVTDENGCSKTGTIEVEMTTDTEDQSLERIKIYPNPVRDQLIIEIPPNVDFDRAFAIFNPKGELVINHQLNQSRSGTYTLQTNELLVGIYVLKITINNETKLRQFIKI